ncbi:MAG: serine protease, partial [Elainella sp.]
MVTKSAYRKALVRFYREEKVIGAGFYVANGYVLTCAHIVTQALGLGKSVQLALAAVAGKSLTLDSPFIAPGQTQTAEVVPSLWRLADADLAVLRVRDTILARDICLPAQNWRRDWNDDDNDAGYGSYESCGFPDGHSGGGWTRGAFVDEQADGWIQLEANKAQGFGIEPGFSGAPVWDASRKAIAGMIVARDKEREDARIGFMLPYAKLKRALEAVELFELLGAAGAEEIPWQRAYQRVRPEID